MGNDLDNAASTPTPSPAPVQPDQTQPAQAAPQAQTQAQPQTQPQAQPSPAAASAPPAPGSFFKNLSHAFVGSVLGGLAGRKTTSYQVDNNPNSPNYGQTMAVNQDMSHGDQLKQIARNALVGLAAGSAQPDRGSKLANALGGLGAGAGAQQKQAQEQDQMKRKQADEDFEQQQRAIVNRSNMAHANAEGLRLHYEILKAGNDMDPQIAQDKEEFKAAQDDDELAPHTSIMTDKDVEQAIKNDHNWPTDHKVYNLGRTIATDSDGNVLTDPQTKEPLTNTKFGVIQANDKMYSIPASFAKDVETYGPSQGIDQSHWEENMEVPFNQYIHTKALITKAKADEIAKIRNGWDAPQDVTVTKPDGTTETVQYNVKSGLPTSDPRAIRPYAPGMKPKDEITEERNAAKDAEQKKHTDLENENLQLGINEKRQQLQMQKTFNAKIPDNYTPDQNMLTMSEPELEKSLKAKGVTIPSNFASLYAVGHYKAGLDTFTKQLRKGVPGATEDDALTAIRSMVNPGYDANNFKAVQGMEKEFASTKPTTAGGNAIAFNTASGHLGALYDAAQALQNGNFKRLNEIAQQYSVETGGSAPVVFDAIRNAVSGEIGKTFKGGTADIPEMEQIQKTINNAQAPQVAQQVAKTYAHLMLTKAGALASHYYGYTGEMPPGLISPAAASVYKRMGIDTREIVPENASVPAGETGQSMTPAVVNPAKAQQNANKQNPF